MGHFFPTAQLDVIHYWFHLVENLVLLEHFVLVTGWQVYISLIYVYIPTPQMVPSVTFPFLFPPFDLIPSPSLFNPPVLYLLSPYVYI